MPDEVTLLHLSIDDLNHVVETFGTFVFGIAFRIALSICVCFDAICQTNGYFAFAVFVIFGNEHGR